VILLVFAFGTRSERSGGQTGKGALGSCIAAALVANDAVRTDSERAAPTHPLWQTFKIRSHHPIETEVFNVGK
jgi:hypothetical protein